jgi:hypothetical protein
MTNTSSRNLEIRRPNRWLATVSLLVGTMIVASAGCKGRTTPTATTTGAATSSSGGGECANLANSSPHKFQPGNYWRHEITILRDQHDLQACAQACVANPECKVATFVDSSTTGDLRSTCVLRSQVGEHHPEESAGICSWVKS